MGNGIGTECGVMRRYSCSRYGEWICYRVRSDKKVNVWFLLEWFWCREYSNEKLQV